MLSKEQRRAALKLTRSETRKLLWELRQRHDMSLEDLSVLSHIPIWQLDYLICGSGQINGSYLIQLAAFYDKRVKIDLIDYPPAKDKNKDKE